MWNKFKDFLGLDEILADTDDLYKEIAYK